MLPTIPTRSRMEENKMSVTADYECAELNMRVFFPKGGACCKNCRFCETDPRMKLRNYCPITFEIIYEPGTIASRCPLEFQAKEDSENA